MNLYASTYVYYYKNICMYVCMTISKVAYSLQKLTILYLRDGSIHPRAAHMWLTREKLNV